MKREEKEELFNRGFSAALDFLSNFDWLKIQMRKNDGFYEGEKDPEGRGYENGGVSNFE
ncbi:hypothetical protein [Chryseobacterium mucoviscidosis]|uniref:hypothetical protein n=1 Tax=Chryseobacterium mucoviscidosis TaxID=1945581 RepID=UPI0031D40193